MMIPLTVALGTAYDFTMAESRQDQIDGMADIATLAGVTPTEMATRTTTAAYHRRRSSQPTRDRERRHSASADIDTCPAPATSRLARRSIAP